MLRALWDGAGEVGPLSLDALVRHRVTVLGTHTLYPGDEQVPRTGASSQYARGVEHALMWAQYATAAPLAPLSRSRWLLIEPSLQIRHG